MSVLEPLSGPARLETHVADPPIQLPVALRRVDGDLELLEELVKTFQEDLPERIQRLKAAIDRGDSQETARSAHSLRGSLGILAAQQAQSLATELETLATEGRLDEAAGHYQALERELERLSAFFSSPDWQTQS
jgi:HPt (histidine-containing phosphotransfer) domain-containing protein